MTETPQVVPSPRHRRWWAPNHLVTTVVDRQVVLIPLVVAVEAPALPVETRDYSPRVADSAVRMARTAPPTITVVETVGEEFARQSPARSPNMAAVAVAV
jgi:hypothetical protein